VNVTSRTAGRFIDGTLIAFVILNWELINTFPGTY